MSPSWTSIVLPPAQWFCASTSAGAAGDVHPCGIIAMEIADGDDARRRRRGRDASGRRGKHRAGKDSRPSQEPPQHGGECCTAISQEQWRCCSGSRIAAQGAGRPEGPLAVSLEVAWRIHDIFRVQGAFWPPAKEMTWPIGKTRKRPA